MIASQWVLWVSCMTSPQLSQLEVNLKVVHSLLYIFSVCVEVRFVRFNLHTLQLEICGLFEVDTFFSSRTTPNNMEIGKVEEFSISV